MEKLILVAGLLLVLLIMLFLFKKYNLVSRINLGKTHTGKRVVVIERTFIDMKSQLVLLKCSNKFYILLHDGKKYKLIDKGNYSEIEPDISSELTSN